MRRSERGLSHSVEAAVVLPVIMVLLLGVVQIASYWHCRNAAIAAAQLTAEQQRRYLANSDTAAGYRILARAGVSNARIDLERGPQQVRVIVTGSAPAIVEIPGLGRIVETAVMPTERVTRP